MLCCIHWLYLIVFEAEGYDGIFLVLFVSFASPPFIVCCDRTCSNVSWVVLLLGFVVLIRYTVEASTLLQ